MPRKKQITVVGSGGRVPPEVCEIAERVGELVAERGVVLICGGKGGVMEAVCRGAKRKGGLTIGILPDGIEEARIRGVHVACSFFRRENDLHSYTAHASSCATSLMAMKILALLQPVTCHDY